MFAFLVKKKNNNLEILYPSGTEISDDDDFFVNTEIKNQPFAIRINNTIYDPIYYLALLGLFSPLFFLPINIFIFKSSFYFDINADLNSFLFICALILTPTAIINFRRCLANHSYEKWLYFIDGSLVHFGKISCGIIKFNDIYNETIQIFRRDEIESIEFSYVQDSCEVFDLIKWTQKPGLYVWRIHFKPKHRQVTTSRKNHERHISSNDVINLGHISYDSVKAIAQILEIYFSKEIIFRNAGDSH